MVRMLFDYHTHTVYSRNHHGKGTIEGNVLAAREKGLEAIAITDHGPGHLFYGVHRKNFPKIRAEIDRLQEKYPDIKIFMGVEANIVDNETGLDLVPEDLKYMDFLLGGYHFGIAGGHMIGNKLFDMGLWTSQKHREKLCEVNTAMTLRALDHYDLKILTHPGDKGPLDMDAVAKSCEQHGVWMEISAHHTHLTVEEIKTCMKYDVSFVISSDAHKSEVVGTFLPGLERAKAAGLDLDRIVNIGR